LPWLESKPSSQRTGFSATPDVTLVPSDSQTKLLAVTDVRPTPHESQVTSSAQQSSVNPPPDTPKNYNNIIPRQLQPSSIDEVIPPQFPTTEASVGKDPIMLSMEVPKVGDLRQTTIEKPFLDTMPRKRSLIGSVYASEDPPSPIFNEDANDSLTELDSSPLTEAIKRVEDLMLEAEGLVNEAADSGHSAEAEEVID
jgi:hypothetical protein